MKLWTLALAGSLVLAGGCNRNTTTPPSPKTDTSSVIPQAAAGSSTTRERREAANPTQGEVDPKEAVQQRDFRTNDTAKN